ncbi:Serine/threonine-protein kinase AfsK [Anatilimnocola aggregata]|uniref:Serine/threonine-protein kinase AfsK n=1 Tax=Anatilimnocola aggregata TaxID=2528021 RepID=A0A517YJ91_9BACT|nr:PQQ-binding-like beta-propeller repeat protein [Anatilimnocola aggregata]QDU30297.1 Serine/threonine-protein kinase AfsK [Anatilimnocola aggregata]
MFSGRLLRILVLLLLMFAASRVAAEDWLQFRGPSGNGCATAKNLPESWGGFIAPAWQTNIPGNGWSSPIIVGDRIWLTSAEQTALTAKQREAKLATNPILTQDFQTHSAVTLFASELDLSTGKILRAIELFTANDPAPIHAQNSYASPTPACDGERLYCHFGSLGTVCLNIQSGQVLWKTQLSVDDITGPGGSPILYQNTLLLACDGTDQQFVIALDKLTGKPVWKTSRPPIAAADNKHKRGFSTPLVITFNGQEQLISVGAQWVCSYNPTTGKEIWRSSFGAGHAVVPRPVYQDGLVYICTGFMKPELWAIKVDGTGDVTNSHLEWSVDSQVPELSSPLVAGGELYFVSSKGVASCLDAKTGDEVWKHRLSGNFAASPILADDKLYFTSQEGVTYVLKPGRKFEEISTNHLFGQVQASPAIAGDSLLLRTQSQLFRLRNPQ